jgi:hypothetical protein
MATAQGRTRNGTESRLAQGAAEEERFRRQLLRTPKGVVCREFNVAPLPGKLQSHGLGRNTAGNCIPFRLPTPMGVSAGCPLEPAAQSCTIARIQL